MIGRLWDRKRGRIMTLMLQYGVWEYHACMTRAVFDGALVLTTTLGYLYKHSFQRCERNYGPEA